MENFNHLKKNISNYGSVISLGHQHNNDNYELIDKNVGNKLIDFRIISELGRGSYGVVKRVESLLDHKEYVMKKINIKQLKQKHQKEALKEAQILSKVRHPNIISYYTSFVENDYLYIIMEYAEGGDLQMVIFITVDLIKYHS